MERIHFLTLNFNGSTCRKGNCRKLIDLIWQRFPNANLEQCEIKEDSRPVECKAIYPDIVFLLITRCDTNSSDIEQIRQKWPEVPLLGVFCPNSYHTPLSNSHLISYMDDFICCPITPIDFELRVLRHVKKKMPLEGLSNSKEWHNKYTQDGLIGKNPVFRKALEKIAVLAIAEAPVLICGETGTGKELFARAIHYHGSRKGGPFIPVNCGALPDHIFENELFGHTKGAFTDASFEQKGLIGEAEGGTLFLDEIDALSFAAQIKLLRFLQDAEFRPLGSSKSFKANVRVLTATNKDIQQIVIDKEFRADLFYRISFFSLVIPPLRERLDDIPALTDYFIAKTMAPNPKKTSSLSSDCLSKLMGYTWPGNIRELQGVLQRSLAFSTSDQIGAYDIDLPFTCHTNDGTDDTFRIAKSKVVKQFERSYLLNLLATYRGNVSKASKAAGKERRSFQRLLRKYGLQRNVFLRTHSPSHEYNNASGLQRDS